MVLVGRIWTKMWKFVQLKVPVVIARSEAVESLSWDGIVMFCFVLF